MGLDMFAYIRNDDEEDSTEIAYWRKHNRLHGWMENLYRQKGGTAESFNCIPLQLTTEDLDRLERDVKSSNLPATQGFFFGSDSAYVDEDERNFDLEFIAKARQAIEDGNRVYYDSWW